MTDPTIADIYQRVARKIGGRTGVVLTGSTTTSVLLGGLVGTTGSDSAYSQNRVILLNETLATDRERLVTRWTDATGAATVPVLGNAPTAGDPYLLLPPDDYTLNEFDLAFETMLRETKRTYRQVIPITPNSRVQWLDACPWLQGGGQVDAVYMNVSPIYLHNEDFALWQNGPNAAPDGWTEAGTGGSVARVSGGHRSAYAVQLTSGMSEAKQLRQSMPPTFVQWLLHRTAAVTTPVRGAGWGRTANANSTRIGIYDGVTTHYASYIAADGLPHFPTLSVPIFVDDLATQSEFTLVLEVAAGGNVGTFDAALIMQNTTSADVSWNLKDQGSPFYQETEVYSAKRNAGGLPQVEYQTWPNTYGQIIVYSRREFPAYVPATDGYDTEIEFQYARVMEAGLAKWLLSAVKPQQDRARLDRILAEETSIWNRFNSNIIDLPVAKPPVQISVGSA